MRTAVVAAVVLLAVGAAQATTVSYSASIPVGMTNWNMNPSLAQWDPALFPGQVLTQVKLSVTASVTGDARAESLDAAASVVNYGVSATVTATGPGGLIVNVLPLAGGAFNASAFDGTVDFGGTSGFSQLNLSNSAMAMNTLNVGLGAYIGAGSIVVPTSATGASFANGPGNIVSSFRTLSGADLTIEYTFEAIPAPATAALLGLGGLAATRRRRN